MTKINIFYNEKQQVESNSSFSPSAGKPKKVLEDWKKWNLPIRVISPSPLTRSDMALAHDPEYIKGVLDCKVSNGFGNKKKEVANSLPWTTGSLASAAQFAVKNRYHAVSLTSGFHHSCYSNGGGFCTLNGLVIAAQLLKLHGYVKRVGILDLDQHYGNGTDDIIKKLDLDYIEHYTLGGHNWNPSNADKFLEKLPEIFDDKFRDVDVLIIQLGADSSADDPLGGVFSIKQIRQRDRKVFELCKKLNLPFVWNLAGGYQDRFENVLSIHRTAAEEYLRVFHGVEVDTKVEENYELKVKRVFVPSERVGESSWSRTTDDWDADEVVDTLTDDDWAFINDFEKEIA